LQWWNFTYKTPKICGELTDFVLHLCNDIGVLICLSFMRGNSSTCIRIFYFCFCFCFCFASEGAAPSLKSIEGRKSESFTPSSVKPKASQSLQVRWNLDPWSWSHSRPMRR
jgi:hypothetical protein